MLPARLARAASALCTGECVLEFSYEASVCLRFELCIGPNHTSHRQVAVICRLGKLTVVPAEDA